MNNSFGTSTFDLQRLLHAAAREEQIIPAIYKGHIDDAKKIANSIQLERLSKMWGIMSCK